MAFDNSGPGQTGTELIPDLNNLRSYAQIKMALGELLRITHQGFITLGRNESEEQCQELLVKLAEDRFTLAVLGQFKRGKSSLMNAIVGQAILPTGVLPLTSAITILRYGPKERLIIEKEKSLFPSELPITDLPDYVTEKGNPENQKKVKAAYIELPTPFLRYGLEFVDTPGVGSTIKANTETTYSFLPSCDAALFVTSVDTPMTAVELDFLNTIKEYVHKVFIIVNKVDLVSDKERKEILDFVGRTVQSNMGAEVNKIFPVSCQTALAAKTSGKADVYEASGLKTLEDALALFLTEEKSAAFLAAITQKAIRIIESEKASGTFTEKYIQERTATIKAEKVRSIHEDPQQAAVMMMKATTTFVSIQQLINEGKSIADTNTEQPAIPTGQEDISTPIAQNSSNAKEVDLETDLQTRGCAVCEHIIDRAFDFFSGWQYQLTINEQTQASFASGVAFCPLHTWQLQAMSSPQGASIGYARLAEEMGRRLKGDNSEKIRGEEIRHWIHNSGNCPVCKLLHEAEQQYVLQLLASLEETEGKNRYRHSDGSCLYHLSLMLDAAHSDAVTDFILHHAAEKFEQDAEDMRGFALKNVALRRSLQNQNEMDAYLRTIIRIVGEHNVCVPWAQDGQM